MQSQPSNAIGVFDSGVGGLTVVSALMQTMPKENIIYFGDTARVPYGVKSVDTIVHYSSQITEFLLNRQVKMLIVACNTMAAVAAQQIKSLATVPVLDVLSAGAACAASMTVNKRVSVIGTPATINSGAYTQAIERIDPFIKVIGQPCPLFVPLAEEGWVDHPVTWLTAEEYLRPVLDQQIDTLVLGCTHYPLLKPVIQDVAGAEVQLIDSAITVAERASRLLDQMQLRNRQAGTGHYEFHVTDVPYRFQAIGERFLGRALDNINIVKW
jgi:glutamate racemase